MGSLGALLSSLIISAPSRMLAALGMGFVSYAGYALIVDQLIVTIQSNWSNIGVDIISFMTLAGFTTGFGIILGCVVTRLALTQIQSLAKIS